MNDLPPGLTCADCERPMTATARRTDRGWVHYRRCPRPCGVEGCEMTHHAKGYCEHHLRNVRRHGHPLGKPAMELEDIEWMAETGETWEGAAKRLQRTPDGVWRFLDREGRLDLHARLRANERSEVAA